jgi:general secretion pathway protein D
MAASDSRSRVMSTPIILTTDNTEAHITSTEKIYVLDSVTQRSTTEGGDYQNYSKQDVGLDLKVKPRINANRFVMLEVEQTLSEPNPNAVSDVNSLAGTTIYKERKIEAKVVVKSGQTVVLGGAVREQNQEDSSRIPILGNIPLLGRLFSYKSNQQKRTETVVFLTPFVLDSQSEIEAETRRRKNSLSEGGIWKQGGWSGSTLGEPPDVVPKPDAAMRDLEPVAAPGDAPRPGG